MDDSTMALVERHFGLVAVTFCATHALAELFLDTTQRQRPARFSGVDAWRWESCMLVKILASSSRFLFAEG